MLLIFLTNFRASIVLAEDALNRTIQRVSNDTSLVHGHWAMVAIVAASGEFLVNVNGEKSLAPASCMKLVTSAAALCLLGEEYRFQTRLGYTGYIDEDSLLHGDLYVIGGADPTLGSDRFDPQGNYSHLLAAWADTVKKAGIQSISGNVVADDRHFDRSFLPRNWIWEDMGNYYGAGTSGLCFNENAYRLYFRPGAVGQLALLLSIEPQIPGLSFVNYMLTGPPKSGDNGYIFGAPLQWQRVLRGTIPAGVRRFSIKGSMPDPAKACAELFTSQLEKSNVIVEGEALSQSDPECNLADAAEIQIIFTQNSPPLKEIVYWLNKRSINLYAEQLLKQLAKEINGQGTYENGFKVLGEFLASREIPLKGLHLHDGSGLSRFTMMTALQLAMLLRRMTTEPCFHSFYNSLPVVGDPEDEGTLSHFGVNTRATKNARVKSGLINRIRAHSGYVTTTSGRLVCFAMFANDFSSSPRHIDKLHEVAIARLAELP
ncbi:D-alanyl-D-alanine carboxypeptidase/D-alanyl-D-alanine-endopeptidase [candidate division KSB1 bacterium]|nr:D-alanyl-D-alanine carboxypeptidase/D-alanyl-D-alanine-endopeptidase [candidate division KSB1 bacterium]